MPGSEIKVLANCLPWVFLLTQSHVELMRSLPHGSGWPLLREVLGADFIED